MTQYEILKLASVGICTRMERENEINGRTKKEYGRDNRICLHKLDVLTKQFDEVQRMMGEIERANA